MKVSCCRRMTNSLWCPVRRFTCSLLPKLAQMLILRMLFLDQPVPWSAVRSWLKPEYITYE